MENQLQIFESEEFGTVRILGDRENPLFCLPDVCRILDLRVDNVITRLKGDPFTTGVIFLLPIADSLGRIQMTNFVNEDGLYDVILDSRKPEARKFRKWITNKVLPSIRKYGYYVAPNIENILNNMAQELAENGEELACLTAQTPVLSLQMEAMMIKILADYRKNPDKIFPVFEDLPGEIWKWVTGYEGLYQGSIFGRVRSFALGKCYLLKPVPNQKGYCTVGLHDSDGNPKTVRINRLIAELFIPNPENKPEVHHKDHNKTNNRADNLEWVTDEENKAYAIEKERFWKGEKNPVSKLTEKDVREIRQNYKSGDLQFGAKALARKYHVSDNCINSIVTFKTWKHVQ